ncbi:hypothetical protein H0H87_007325 [Tephrocybe sp. NHM501043]|nr:hypothetical protein H0H87_007325 [Tephrocybe sp. NHM501043]
MYAKGLGLDVTQLDTRRIEAKFLPMDQRTSSAAKEDSHVPRILVTGDGEISTGSRSISPASSGHQRPHSITGHTTSTHYSFDVKSSHSSRGPSPTLTPGEGPSSTTTAPSQAEIARRMRDLLAKLEHQVAAPATDNGAAAVVQLQRQVEILQRENEELRMTGTDVAPPAYEGSGRF